MQAAGVSQFSDVLIVDGGSSDGSLEPGLLISLDVHYLVTKLGPGKLSAQLLCAYSLALEKGYEGVVTIDGNDKDDPVSISEFIKKLQEGYDFVHASRFIRGGQSVNAPFSRIVGIRLLHAPLLAIAAGFRWTDTTQGFRAYSAQLLGSSRLSIFRPVFDSYELLPYLNVAAPRNGFKCVEVPTSRIYPTGAVPTKIKGLRSNLQLISVLLKAVTGRYNPK
jgi:dolichol-phosphate mannosyltransferase